MRSKEMMDTILAERQRISDETLDEWTYGIEKCQEEEIKALSENMSETIQYLKEDCSASDYSWISEVFEDIAQITQSLEFIETLYELSEKYPDETNKYNVKSFIDDAKNLIED